MAQKIRITPVKGSRPSKRKCVKKDICESYGYCSPNCPEYEKITRIQLDKQEANKYLEHLDEKGLAVMKKRPPFIQTPCPPHLMSICLAYFKEEGYTYVDSVLVNHLMPILLFERE